jgi:dTMP kinase
LIRKNLGGGGFDDMTMALLFAADRMNHYMEEVADALHLGRNVICDRYYHSSYAYQGSDERREWIRHLNRFAKVPDLTILVDVPIEVAIERIEKRGKPADNYETADRLLSVRAAYGKVIAQERALGHRVEVIDGRGTPAEVLALALGIVGLAIEPFL